MARKRRLTGHAALEVAFQQLDHTPLLQAWGVELSDENLCLALTHSSFANENDNVPDNERLEFLGDAVLGLCVAEQLYRQYPKRSESEISKMRAAVVNSYALADVARELNMGPHLLLGRGEIRTGGRDKHSILEDAVEALIGAIYLEHGFEVTRATILRIFASRIDNATAASRAMDWKTTLVELLSDMKLPIPEYETSITGPEHDQTFHAVATVAEEFRTQGQGRTKREAEHMAAKEMINRLRQ